MQKAAVEVSKAKLEQNGKFKKPIVTEITPAPEFWQAEEYHQQYLEKRGLATSHFRGFGEADHANKAWTA